MNHVLITVNNDNIMNENLDLNLYHGTDARIISMSETERNAYLSNCQKVIDYLWDTYKPYHLTYEDVETELNGNKAYVSRSKLKTTEVDNPTPQLFDTLEIKVLTPHTPIVKEKANTSLPQQDTLTQIK